MQPHTPPELKALWGYQLAEMTAFTKSGAANFRSRSARLLVQRRQPKARSTMPWRRRLARVDFPVWTGPFDGPSLISLYVELGRTEDGQGPIPQ